MRVKNQKSLQIKKSNDMIEQLNNKFINTKNNQNNALMSFFNMVNYAHSHLNPEREKPLSRRTKPTSTLVLPEIVMFVLFCEYAGFWMIEGNFKDKLSNRQLKRALQLLVNLKWLVRRGRSEIATYYSNPFLAVQIERHKSLYFLAEYSRLKIDFFDLLNLPLLNALTSNQKITKTEVEFTEYKIGFKKPWIRAFFEGDMEIRLHAESGNIYQTFLPVNFHASPKLNWKEENGKKIRVQEPYGFPHHTIPLRWVLFDITESRQYTKKRRKSRWDKNLGKLEYIHFDNSFKILHYTDIAQYLAYNKPFENALKKWNTKTCEYVEVGDFKTLENLFYNRFVRNKRKNELFEALGLRYMPISGRPKKK